MGNAMFWFAVLVCFTAFAFDFTFLTSGILLLFTKKAEAFYKDAVSSDDDYRKYAMYYCDGVTYRNIFPAQDSFNEKVYLKNKAVRIRILPKFKLAIDKVTLITIWIGVVFSVVYSCFAYYIAINILF